jgi:choline dehydrogenase-like flavoprotein
MINSSTVIVIGSGPSGAMAAHELVRKGCHVIMLESGCNLPDGMLVRVMGRNLYRRWPEQGMKDGSIDPSADESSPHWWYNLSPGGLSNNWTAAVPRFDPEDFHEGERLHECYRWPLSYQDLQPYYEQVERLLFVSGDPKAVPQLPASTPVYKRRLPRDWQQVAKEASCRGQGMTVMPLAEGPPNLIVGRSTAFNSYTNIIEPLRRFPNFQIITGAHALSIEYSGMKKCVEAVVYQDRTTNSQHRLEADAVVVACGPLHSTKLLFDSACPEFPHGLGNGSGLLGRYLHDHPRDWWTFELEKPLTRPSPPVYLTRLPHRDSAPLVATSWTIGLLPSTREKILSMTPLKTTSLATQVFGTMVPTERNYVQPDAELKDEFGRPKLQICIQFDDGITKTMIGARQHLLSLLEDAGYKGTLREVPTDIVPGSSVHYGGTVRMHNSRKYGVLDGWNRLHDISNLLVVDASCFTTGPEKNPTLTAMALAARAADRLVDDMANGGPVAI